MANRTSIDLARRRISAAAVTQYGRCIAVVLQIETNR